MSHILVVTVQMNLICNLYTSFGVVFLTIKIKINHFIFLNIGDYYIYCNNVF